MWQPRWLMPARQRHAPKDLFLWMCPAGFEPALRKVNLPRWQLLGIFHFAGYSTFPAGHFELFPLLATCEVE